MQSLSLQTAVPGPLSLRTQCYHCSRGFYPPVGHPLCTSCIQRSEGSSVQPLNPHISGRTVFYPFPSVPMVPAPWQVALGQPYIQHSGFPPTAGHDQTRWPFILPSQLCDMATSGYPPSRPDLYHASGGGVHSTIGHDMTRAQAGPTRGGYGEQAPGYVPGPRAPRSHSPSSSSASFFIPPRPKDLRELEPEEKEADCAHLRSFQHPSSKLNGGVDSEQPPQCHSIRLRDTDPLQQGIFLSSSGSRKSSRPRQVLRKVRTGFSTCIAGAVRRTVWTARLLVPARWRRI